jgi:hypothetical protein
VKYLQYVLGLTREEARHSSSDASPNVSFTPSRREFCALSTTLAIPL